MTFSLDLIELKSFFQIIAINHQEVFALINETEEETELRKAVFMTGIEFQWKWSKQVLMEHFLKSSVVFTPKLLTNENLVLWIIPYFPEVNDEIDQVMFWMELKKSNVLRVIELVNDR
jgi:hypothetical protein